MLVWFMRYNYSTQHSEIFSLDSLEASLLLGLHMFDFSRVQEDPCTSSLASKQVRVKVTACSSGQFTCDDGECVSIEERCNQISNCR